MKYTPWGQAQHQTKLADGIIFYITAGHGGIWLSAKRQAALPACNNWLNTKEWWEEDCDWAVPYIFFGNDIQKYGAYQFNENLSAAYALAEHHHPDFFKAHCVKTV